MPRCIACSSVKPATNLQTDIITMRRDAYFNRTWYEDEPPAWWQHVLAIIFRFVSALRRGFYRVRILRGVKLDVPVIVIGNLTAGGTGKTPLTLALVRELGERGFKPGIVSRGYGGRPGKTPLHVTAETPVSRAGDEAVMLAARSNVPVFVHPRRARAAQALLATHSVDVIICDDGLQHYALARDIEIAVVDGQRGLGNGKLLPAGPLREPTARLRSVNHVVINGEMSAQAQTALSKIDSAKITSMQLEAVALVNISNGERRPRDTFVDRHCAAVAGIGNPQRFFSTLGELDYRAECRAFPDHYTYKREDFEFAGERPLLMTEKDAVKCRAFAAPGWWYLEIAASLETSFIDALAARLKRLQGEIA
ncbi:MAG TPA: tetraacyldisaccharide 4'-kinase [Gammaproteobacteria bacterium]